MANELMKCNVKNVTTVNHQKRHDEENVGQPNKINFSLFSFVKKKIGEMFEMLQDVYDTVKKESRSGSEGFNYMILFFCAQIYVDIKERDLRL